MAFSNNQIEIEALPKMESIAFIPVEKSYYKILIANQFFIYGSIIVILFIIKLYAQNIKFHTYFWYIFTIPVLLLIVKLVITTLGFKKRKYALREKDISYTQGLLVNTITTLPFNRIQHTEIKRSFLARKLKLSSLTIFSAGESGGDITIKGLPKEKAETINAYLTQLLNERK